MQHRGQLEGHTALITGASGSVGSAVARALAEEDARTVLVGRRLDALRQAASSMGAGRRAAECYEADLTSDVDLGRLTGEIANDLERLDIVVHSAGTISMGDVECSEVSALDEQYLVNLRAPFALTRNLLPLLRSSRGQVVFINSSVGLRANGGVAAYAATKHGLRAVADGLREEVNRDGIRVLSVFLGRTAGEMQRRVHMHEGRAYREDKLIQPHDVASVVLAALLLDRTAEVTDITIRPAAPPE